jgi:hypothetical protein
VGGSYPDHYSPANPTEQPELNAGFCDELHEVTNSHLARPARAREGREQLPDFADGLESENSPRVDEYATEAPPEGLQPSRPATSRLR